MGGNAIKSVPIRRYQREEFELLMVEVSNILNKYYSKHSHIPFISNKESFGDMDVLIDSSSNLTKLKPIDIINQEFNSREIHCNDGCYSFEYKDFQIDFIFTSKEYFESSLVYYSGNDVSNLLGRIFHKYGLKYGHQGVTYPLRNHFQHEDKQIILSQDPHFFMKFIGLEYKTNFDSVEDMFNYVISSPYFSNDIFSYENLNHINRTRNRKRANYAGFLKYLEDNKIVKTYNFEEDKTKYLPMISKFFNIDLSKIIDDYRIDQERKERIHSIFNGKHLFELGYTGSELGKVLSSYKKSKENFEKFVEETGDTNLIIEDFKKFINEI